LWPLVGAALVLYAMIAYPLIGLLLGRRSVGLPWFGVTPRPTTFGVLLCAEARRRLLVLVIPPLWSIIGGSAAILLQVPQDYGLIAAGVVGLIYVATNLIRRRR